MMKEKRKKKGKRKKEVKSIRGRIRTKCHTQRKLGGKNISLEKGGGGEEYIFWGKYPCRPEKKGGIPDFKKLKLCFVCS